RRGRRPHHTGKDSGRTADANERVSAHGEIRGSVEYIFRGVTVGRGNAVAIKDLIHTGALTPASEFIETATHNSDRLRQRPRVAERSDSAGRSSQDRTGT